MALEPAPDGAPGEQEILGGVDRHHEAEPLAPAALRDIVAPDPDNVARPVEQGPPELPVLMVSSARKNSARGKAGHTLFSAQRALTCPPLNQYATPYGA